MPYFPHVIPPEPGSARDLIELILGYGLIVFILWMPEFPQRILSPVALFVTLAIVHARRPSLDDLGLSRRGLAPSLWILPAAVVLAIASVLVAKQVGTLHALYKSDFKHVAGYVLWTLYQQFLLNDYFIPRLTRLLASDSAAMGAAAVLFAAAHLPNLPLTAATLVWERSRARCSGATTASTPSAWPRDCSASASPSASPTRCIIICAWAWDICGITERNLFRERKARSCRDRSH